eukprot:COSAG02_NODE_1167_length_14137_cov_25.567175_5_plen_188_part_00
MAADAFGQANGSVHTSLVDSSTALPRSSGQILPLEQMVAMLALSKSEALTMARSLHLKQLEHETCSERKEATELAVQWNHTARLCTRSSMRNHRRWLQDQRTFPEHNSGEVRRLKAQLPAKIALGSASQLSKRRGQANSPAEIRTKSGSCVHAKANISPPLATPHHLWSSSSSSWCRCDFSPPRWCS